jgi:hypothetical protein
MAMTVIVVLAVLVFLLLAGNERRLRRWMKAYDLHQDMLSKFKELIDDPFMSETKLKEWLPIFEHADEEIKRICSGKFYPIAPLVMRAIINEIGFSRSA